MKRPDDATAGSQLRIGRIDDGIDIRLLGNIAHHALHADAVVAHRLLRLLPSIMQTLVMLSLGDCGKYEKCRLKKRFGSCITLYDRTGFAHLINRDASIVPLSGIGQKRLLMNYS